MVEIYKLTKRHIDAKNEEELEKFSPQLAQVKMFSTFVGHGIGTIDFSEKIAQMSDEEYENMLQNSGGYTKFKIGNLSKYFEVEIFPEHAQELLKDMSDCKLKEILKELQGGFLVLRKDFVGV
ncbi:formate hydrogenlyase maturation HycH family protein [Campylobacter majalis]|uniref:formate hydrogenlyase maturation HycH family protein n=1 Tax=Campylobacter majalis TaxID=2790656 RepID=UPI003D681671